MASQWKDGVCGSHFLQWYKWQKKRKKKEKISLKTMFSFFQKKSCIVTVWEQATLFPVTILRKVYNAVRKHHLIFISNVQQYDSLCWSMQHDSQILLWQKELTFNMTPNSMMAVLVSSIVLLVFKVLLVALCQTV